MSYYNIFLKSFVCDFRKCVYIAFYDELKSVLKIYTPFSHFLYDLFVTTRALVVLVVIEHRVTQQTRDTHPKLVQCRPTVYDAGPTLSQPWVSVPCLLPGRSVVPWNFYWPSPVYVISHLISSYLDHPHPHPTPKSHQSAPELLYIFMHHS